MKTSNYNILKEVRKMKKTMILAVLVVVGLVVTSQAFASLNTPMGMIVRDPGPVNFENVGIK